MPPKSKLKWLESIEEEDFWLVICFSVIFHEEEEERTSKKASVSGYSLCSKTEFQVNHFPDVFSGSSVLNPSKICHKDNCISHFGVAQETGN